MEDKKKILVIEDNEDVRDNIRELLELSGYEVEIAVDGKQGVIRALQFMPDLILCDVMMPELDGFGVLRIMSNKPELMRIPFIFLTAKTDREDVRKGMNLGADDYIVKPFDDVELLEAIETRLKKVTQLKSDFQFENDSLLSENIEASKKILLDNFKDRASKHFRKKEIVYEQGETLDFLYYVRKGKVKIIKTNEEGKDFVLDILIEGEFFGYMDLVEDGVGTETIVAMEPSEILQIPRDAFQKLLCHNRNISSSFIKYLAVSIKEREEKLLHLAYDSVRRRVASALLVLHQKSKSQGKKNIIIFREDLAGYVGTAKETVIRTLSDFKEEGYINILERGIIEVLDVNGLEEMPN
ncbi:MAG TPA: response regulator [Saprospiraceae bacterium]|nr:response regulator [Saprospiraceae bacterium]